VTVHEFAGSQYRQLRTREHRNRRRRHLLQNARHRGLGEHHKVYFRDQIRERLTHHAIVRFCIAGQNGFKGAIAERFFNLRRGARSGTLFSQQRRGGFKRGA
jgi:hypothetical protein